jgi:hypothetical protein
METNLMVASEKIVNKIYKVRGVSVMLDFDLAQMYQVETRVVNQAAKRNLKRFPEDFMFQLTKDEWEILRSQIVMSSSDLEDDLSQNVMSSNLENRRSQIVITSKFLKTKYSPFAFTEQGVAMLSGLLNSDIAINVNIRIMRAFIAMRKRIALATNKTIEERVLTLEWMHNEMRSDMNEMNDETKKAFADLFNAFTQISKKMDETQKPRLKIGFT